MNLGHSHLIRAIAEVRNKSIEKRKQDKRLICWEERDLLGKRECTAIVFILPTKGCNWASSTGGGCSMCGYQNDSVLVPDFTKHINDVLRNYQTRVPSEPHIVKIFNSGSILDKDEISREIAESLLSVFSSNENLSKIIIESRPEYVTDVSMNWLASIVDIRKIEIGIGLESANDYIRETIINKGFSFSDFIRATEAIRDVEASTKAYLMLKPPLISEKQAITDCISSIEKLKNLHINTISINPTNVQRNTVVENLYETKMFRPPWLWSVLYVLQQGKLITTNQRIMSDPSGAGKARGPHNCGNCDFEIIEAITKISLNQHINKDQIINCRCKKQWELCLAMEGSGFFT